MSILIGADVGGTKTAVGGIRGRRDPGPGRRPGGRGAARPRAGVRRHRSRKWCAARWRASGRLTGDVLVVGAAGAGREPERDELRKALRGENLAERVVVTTDIEIALAAAFETDPASW